MVSQHPAKYSDQRRCGSGNKMVLVYYLILQDHRRKRGVTL